MMPKITVKIEWGHHQQGCQMQVVWVKNGNLRQTRKWNKIDEQFLLKSNQKLYVLYQMVMLPMTLDDP